MNKLAITILVFISCFFVSPAEAKNLEIGKIYRSKSIVNVLTSAVSSESKLTAGAQSKFEVIGEDENFYSIKFYSIYKILNADGKSDSAQVTSDVIYYLEKSVYADKSFFEGTIYETKGGLASGPLVVPFKFRVNDSSLSGDAEIGYYAGWTFDTNFGGRSATAITITPILSVGVSQVSVTTGVGDSTNTENRSAFTWATGVLITNWSKVNIGLLYGQDRAGVNEWQHEGKGWISLSVGLAVE